MLKNIFLQDSLMDRIRKVRKHIVSNLLRFIYVRSYVRSILKQMLQILQLIYEKVPPLEYEKVFGKNKIQITQILENKMIEEPEVIPSPDLKLTNQPSYQASILNDPELLRDLVISDDFILDKDALDLSDIDEPIEATVKCQREPVRPLRIKKHVNYLQQTKMHTDLSYVKYRELKVQPFKFLIDLDAYLFLTIHAHLSKQEVIGLMGGTYDPHEREIRIQRIYPCKKVPTHDDNHNVEMDAEAQLEANELIIKDNLINMGWYHSHPTFKTTPSYVDQRTHELLSSQYCDKIYFGLIICPFKNTIDTICDSFVFFNYNKEVIRIDYNFLSVNLFSKVDSQRLLNLYNNHMKTQQVPFLNDRWYKSQPFRKQKKSYREKLIGAVNAINLVNKALGAIQKNGNQDGESFEQLVYNLLSIQ